MKIQDILDIKRVTKDTSGIYIADLNLSADALSSQKTWEKIYDFSLEKLKKDRIDFNANKLDDHLGYLNSTHTFNDKTVFLEIGCGPSYIGEYMMKKHNAFFVGVDFNYPLLVHLKEYFDSKKYKNYILVHADINNMPLKNNSIDYIYGGGVIEHFKNPEQLISKFAKILKPNGGIFNSIPAFNLIWLLRFYNNIPYNPLLRRIFEFIHLNILQQKILDYYHGYELSFTLSQLKKMHQNCGFKNVQVGSFAFHPSPKRMGNPLLRHVYYTLSKNPLFSPVYYVYAEGLGKK